tara:strand:- start:237 stop:467 length:231 start_codon:yes stop_codon:yes gene_type:complete
MAHYSVSNREALRIIRIVVGDWGETVDPDYASSLLDLQGWGAEVSFAMEKLEWVLGPDAPEFKLLHEVDYKEKVDA